MEIDPNTTLWQHWNRLAHQRPDAEIIVHWNAGLEPFRWNWRSLLDRAEFYARSLAATGVKKGDVCAIILRHNKEFYPIYMGIEALGALPAVLAYPNARLHPNKFRQGLEGMSRYSGLDWLLTESAIEPMVRLLATGVGSSIKAIMFPLEWKDQGRADGPIEMEGVCDSDVSPSDPCLLQHSSGTTGLQKGVLLSHRAVLQQIDSYGRAISLQPVDKVISWLPLYHDMGLIAAFHLPLAFGIPIIQLDPFEWVSAPVLLLEAAFLENATIAWLPNFAYDFMTNRIHEEDLAGIRLDHVRLLVNCSEPVRFSSHDRFARRYARYGLKRETLAACYAMAETTFAVTQTAPGAEAPILKASRLELSGGRYVPAMPGQDSVICVSSGSSIPGCDVMVVDDQFKPLPEGRVGEIIIRSVSMFVEYRNCPMKTAEAMRDGWYRSGDNGFCWEGQYYVLGRKKDIIIVAGNNLYPEDIEDAVACVEGLTPGRVVAFGIEDEESGTEQVCVIAETPAEGAEERKALHWAIVQAGMGIDVTISHVYLVSPRWLYKSSSGKPSRTANKRRALEELRSQ